MRTLIVEDDPISQTLLVNILSQYGTCEVARNGKDAIASYKSSMQSGTPFDLICLDIMMPEMDGHEVLKTIRRMEKEDDIDPADEVKIIMITALSSPKDVFNAYYHGKCTVYLVKPIEKQKLIEKLIEYKLIDSP